MHKGGFLIEKFKKDNPNLSGEIKLFVDNTGKIAGVIVGTTAYILNPLKPIWEAYRDAVNDYLVPDIVKEWMNAKAGKVEEGLKSWEKGLTSKQKIILETSIDGVKFGGDIVIVGSTTKLTYTVLEGGVKKVFGKSDEFHSKAKVDVVSVVKSDIPAKHVDGEIKLWQHEGKAHGGHTKEWYVGLSEGKLKDRIAKEGKDLATTYPNEKMAEGVITEVLSKSKNVKKIDNWLKNTNSEGLTLSKTFDKPVGYGIRKGSDKIEYFNQAIVRLVKDANGKPKILVSYVQEGKEMRKIKVDEYTSFNEYNKAVYEQAKRYAKQEDISTDCEYMEIFPIVKEIVSREDYKDEAEYYSNIFKISRSNLKREFYEDDREYYQDIYEYFSNLLFYFYYDGCYPGRKDKDTIERYVKEHEKWKISQTLKEGREILKLQPFPWEWVYNVCGYKSLDHIEGKNKGDKYCKWVIWMVEALEKEAMRVGRL